MTNTINNFVLQVATINGSGSQSANNALVKTLFRMGIPVTGKNMFPSNIAGLPTWFNIRAQSEGFTARKEKCDILVAMNPISIVADQKSLVSGGYCFFNEEINLTDNQKRQDVQYIPIPFKSIVEKLTDSGKLKKLLVNMIYVGVLSELLHLDQLQLNQVIRDLFGNKEKVVDLNLEALKAGLTWARENLKTEDFPFKAQVIPEGNKGKILIDGNSAAALGWVFGGCTMAAWYPITPSSSLVESFQKFSQKYRRDEEGNSRAAIVQAEDELSSICMVLGAGWAGARSATATSGPGLSLMSEAAGFAYFAEIPAVIWNVQRGGPSTGLPTRTQQADLQAAYRLSHGDTQHVLLLPANPKECFEFGQTAFDLSESLQSLVIVLTDLDLGMNLWVSEEFTYPKTPYQRGKVLNAEDLKARTEDFARYRDVDGDGIPFRTLPGTPHPKASYFTRGTGHDEKSHYSEDPEVYRKTLDRLKTKYETARSLVPQPLLQVQPKARIGLIGYGSTDFAIPEVQKLLELKDKPSNYLRLRALPIATSVGHFLNDNDRVYIVEQNRDGQLAQIIREELPQYYQKIRSILQYDGMPIAPDYIYQQILQIENAL